MTINDFVRGMHLQYEDVTGYVNFIGTEYITLTLHKINQKQPLRDVNLLIYPHQWNKIKPVPVHEVAHTGL